MTEEELIKARRERTWLVWTAKVNLIAVYSLLVTAAKSYSPGHYWYVHHENGERNGAMIFVNIRELRIATPQDFLLLGEP